MFTKTKNMNQECTDDIFCAVNTAIDVDQATNLEKKHLPVISAPECVKKGQWFDVTVEVGKFLDHPNEPGHFIQFIELYAGDTFLTRMDFTAQTTHPIMTTRVCLDHSHGKLRSFARCNLHGSWEYDVDIMVTD